MQSVLLWQKFVPRSGTDIGQQHDTVSRNSTDVVDAGSGMKLVCLLFRSSRKKGIQSQSSYGN